MNVFGIGLPELVVIAAIGLLVFGPKRLPELGKTLGRTLKGFQSASLSSKRSCERQLPLPKLWLLIALPQKLLALTSQRWSSNLSMVLRPELL